VRRNEFETNARRLRTAIDAGGGAKAAFAAIEAWTARSGDDSDALVDTRHRYPQGGGRQCCLPEHLGAPIFTDIPFELGKDLTIPEVAEIVRGMRMALAVNALGLPAVALPVGIGDGLAQSVQVIGPRYREYLFLEAGAALEDRVGIITPIDPR
jgi:hypothetical protein